MTSSADAHVPADRRPRRGPPVAGLLLAGVLLALPAGPVAAAAGDHGPGEVETASTAISLQPVETCTGSFERHTLGSATRPETINLYESNGSGVAAGDLTGNGLPDLVLPSVTDPTRVLINDGDFTFREHQLTSGRHRAVQLVDIDGDDRLDIVLSTGLGTPEVYRNAGTTTHGELELERIYLTGVRRLAYAMDWADLDRSGRLDLVTASYDAELARQLGHTFLTASPGGVTAYLQDDTGRFDGIQLADEAQALALAIHDVDGDGWPDVLVGNDFVPRDRAWLGPPSAWQPAEPFSTTTMNTMSYDLGDVFNDGRMALFATDMAPYPGADPGPWNQLAEGLDVSLPANDPQMMENVLLSWSATEGFQDSAGRLGISATGWSWAGLLGDLDNDGHLDAYVVNGMIAEELFASLPGHELVEENQAFYNAGGRAFVPAPGWDLGSTASGRGAVMVDLDNDGRLDIVVNNLGSPAELFENRLCGGSAIAVDLRWPESGNTRAIGATVELTTSEGRYLRDVRVGRGYLSGADPRIHIGFPASERPEQLTITWPDGLRSSVDRPTVGTNVLIERSTTMATAPAISSQSVQDGNLGPAAFRDAITREGIVAIATTIVVVLLVPPFLGLLGARGRRNIGALTLLSATVVQGVHQLEHVIQVVGAKALGHRDAQGVIGAAIDLEWVHLSFNAVLLAALVLVLTAYRGRGLWPREDRLSHNVLYVATALQLYHVIEHVVKVHQQLTTGWIPAPGILGQRFDLIWLHAGLNVPVTALLILAVVRLHALRRRVPPDQPAQPPPERDPMLIRH